MNSSTLYRWSTAVKKNSGEQLYPEFCIAYARAKNCQMVYVLETGFVGASRGSFVNLFMKNVHKWADKTQQEASRSLGIDLEQVNKDLEAAAAEEAAPAEAAAEKAPAKKKVAKKAAKKTAKKAAKKTTKKTAKKVAKKAEGSGDDD